MRVGEEEGVKLSWDSAAGYVKDAGIRRAESGGGGGEGGEKVVVGILGWEW